MEISKIIEKLHSNGNIIQGVNRHEYKYNLEKCLKIVEAIGKERTPKFVIDDENRFVFENLIRWVCGDPAFSCQDPVTKEIIPGNLRAGIYIAGNTGTGKSWALEIMASFCRIDNVQVTTGQTRRCLSWPCFRVDSICDEYSSSGEIDKYKRMQVLAIQDLGTEPEESVYMGNRVQVLCQILENRGDRSDQITLISSNLQMGGEKLVKLYGDRVASRLVEMCNYLELRGKDRRKIK